MGTLTDTRTDTMPDGTSVVTNAYSDGRVEVVTTPAPGSVMANRQTLQQRAQAALAANGTYLAIGSPTAGQNAAQVQALTKQCNGIIRLLLGALDSTTGT